MPSPLKGSATYKKKPGVLALSSDSPPVVTWTAAGAASSELSMAVASITNLQQTGASSPKVMLKIFQQLPGSSEATPFTFTFASDDQGRAEAGAIRDALSKAIAALKNAAMPATPPAPASADGEGSSAAMAIAAAVSATAPGLGGAQYDDETLLKDGALQEALLKKDKQLASTFHQAMKARPQSVAITAFNRQFWALRVRLLRAFAVEQAQKRGEYNVLGAVKPRMEGDDLKLSLTVDQAQLILRQYPIVQKANQEAMAKKIDNPTFWTRFFQSRLYKKLKGEKILDSDKKDDLLDKYLSGQNDDMARQQKLLAAHVPHIIDLEGNEQDNSQKLGNAPDYLNRPTAVERVPIMRTLNSISERLLAKVAPNDIDPSEPIGVDEATYNEMALKDLAGDVETQHRLLNIKDKARFFATGQGTDDSSTVQMFGRQKPKDVVEAVNADLRASGNTSLAEAIGVDDSDPDDEMDEGDSARDTHVGSRISRKHATAQVFELVRERRDQVKDQLAGFDEGKIADEFGLSKAMYQEVVLANAAAVVFLGHFWSAFQSGDASRAGELQGVVEALSQYLATFVTIGETAEKDRQSNIDDRKQLIRAHYKRTNRQVAFDPNTIKGGAKVVEQLFSSSVKSVRRAIERYQQALTEAKNEAKREAKSEGNAE